MCCSVLIFCSCVDSVYMLAESIKYILVHVLLLYHQICSLYRIAPCCWRAVGWSHKIPDLLYQLQFWAGYTGIGMPSIRRHNLFWQTSTVVFEFFQNFSGVARVTALFHFNILAFSGNFLSYVFSKFSYTRPHFHAHI